SAYSDAKHGFLVVNEREEKAYDLVGKYIAFSADSRHLAYVARSGNQELVIIDGLEGKPYDIIPSPIIATQEGFRYLGYKDNHVYLIEERIQ
ncbi:MAG TPA: hypothetical protein VMN99_00805, partial [Anaerolineales bacterium]|nr:hypothetical protein [Anaerolineales bacterium]